MYICKYCQRNLKNFYEVCPGCGSSHFEKIPDFKEKVINTPPTGGYKLNLDSYKYEKKSTVPFVIIGYVLTIISIFFFFFFLRIKVEFEYALIFFAMLALFLGLGIFFLKDSINKQKKCDEDVKRVSKLAQNGMLIKNLDYEIISLGVQMDGVTPVYRVVVMYKNQSGVRVPFYSNPKYNTIPTGISGTADLLVDPNDFSNYYIDFEIY